MAVVFLSILLPPLAPPATAIEKPMGTGHRSEPRAQISEPGPDRLTVSAIHGQAFSINDDGGLSALRRGGLISANQPVKVGPKSGLDLQTRDGGTLELGPDAELMLYPPGRIDDVDATTTGVRLNNGYLKVAIKAPRTGRFNVSFGRWVAELKPGAYLFETRNNESSVCMLNGEMRVSGAPNSSTALEPYSCVQLTGQAARPMRLTRAEWADMDTHRVVNPVLTEVSRRERITARDRPEARVAANPTPTIPMRPEAPVPPPQSLSFDPVDDLARTLEGGTARQPGTLVDAQGTSKIPQPAPAVAIAVNDPTAVAPDATPQEGLAESDATARETSPLEWIVNVATHASLESAEVQAAQLRSRNLPASIRRETVRGRTAYRVVVEGLATEQAANGVVRMLVSDLGVRQAWAFRKR